MVRKVVITSKTYLLVQYKEIFENSGGGDNSRINPLQIKANISEGVAGEENPLYSKAL